MALTSTTLASAVGANDMQIKVTSATGFAAGNVIRVDNEVMVQTAAASGTFIPVRRGLEGSAQLAHGILSAVTTGLSSDLANPPVNQFTLVKGGDPARITLGADATITAADLTSQSGIVYVLAKATAAAITLGAPTGAQDGLTIQFVSATAAAHVITATGLFDDGVTGGSKNAATFAAFIGATAIFQANRGKWATVSLKAVTVA